MAYKISGNVKKTFKISGSLNDYLSEAEATGAFITLGDSVQRKLLDFELFGKSVQDGTPTPEAPVEIQSVTNPKVTACGKNLWNNLQVKSPTSRPIISYDETSVVLKEDAGGNYCFWLDTLYDAGMYYISYDTDASAVLLLVGSDYELSNFTLNEGVVTESNTVKTNLGLQYGGYRISKKNNIFMATKPFKLGFAPLGSKSTNITFSNIQIEKGSMATDYELYKANTATLSDIVLRSTPDGTRDRVFKDIDGLWRVERNVNEVDLGSIDKTYIDYIVGSSSRWQISIDDMATCVVGTIPSMLITSYIPANTYDVYNHKADKIASIHDSVNLLWIYDTALESLSVDEFITAMSGVMVCYNKISPTYETLPDSVQEELNALESYNHVTNIFTDSELAPDMRVRYTKL